MVCKRSAYCSRGWIALTEKNEWYCGRPSCDFEWFVFDLADIALDLVMTWITVQAGAATVKQERAFTQSNIPSKVPILKLPIYCPVGRFNGQHLVAYTYWSAIKCLCLWSICRPPIQRIPGLGAGISLWNLTTIRSVISEVVRTS